MVTPYARSGYVSATVYNLFTKDTSSLNNNTLAVAPVNNNQTITYDSNRDTWKPGYAVYQATGTPSNSLGNNGDIYFQYIP